MWGMLMGFTNSYYRLNGFVDNGLVWKRKERKLNKYDFTSELEANSFFKNLRIREWNIIPLIFFFYQLWFM